MFHRTRKSAREGCFPLDSEDTSWGRTHPVVSLIDGPLIFVRLFTGKKKGVNFS